MSPVHNVSLVILISVAILPSLALSASDLTKTCSAQSHTLDTHSKEHRGSASLLQARAQIQVSEPIKSPFIPSSPTSIVGACGHTFDFARFDPEDGSWTAEAFIESWEKERSLLRRVPFWMYDGLVGSTNFTAEEEKLQQCIDDERFTWNTHYYFGGAFYFAPQLKKHPWRVAKPEDAELIVVPIVTTLDQYPFADWHTCGWHDFNGEGYCPIYDSKALVQEVLGGELYRNRSQDHVWMTPSDCHIISRNLNDLLHNHSINGSIRGGFRAVQVAPGPWSGRFASLPACRGDSELSTPYYTDPGEDGLDSRDVRFFFGGRTESDAGNAFTARQNLFQDPGSWPANTVMVSNSEIPGLEDCPESIIPDAMCVGRYNTSILDKVQFTICPGGDNPSSPRLYEAVSHGAIPIILSDEAFQTANPFQCLVPYNQISVSVAEKDCAKNCGAAMQSATARFDEAMLTRTRRLLRHFKKDLLWTAQGSRVAENLLLTIALRKSNSTITSSTGCCKHPCYPL